MQEKKIAVIGLGYVGLPLAVALAKGHHQVIGFDINQERVQQLQSKIDITHEVTPEDLNLSTILFTNEEHFLKDANFYIITVPTPINEVNRPDLRMIYAATKTVAKHLKKGDIVVYESTVYPGVTEDECVPLLEQISGLSYCKDFGIGYSPERINPGDKKHRIEDIKKVVSGSDPLTLDCVFELYNSVIKAGVFKAESIKTAEAAKVIENIQRDLNIALINELSIIFNRLGINTHAVLDAAATKWNFARYEPGLVGGHCIGVDPYYLTHCAEQNGYHPEIILAGRRINNRMSEFVALEVLKGVTHLNRKDSQINVTILGLTFKENVPDIRNTKVIDIINVLKEFNVNVQICDPYADKNEVKKEYGIELTDYTQLQPADGIILAVKHQPFVEENWELITQLSNPRAVFVADLKNCLPDAEKPSHVTLWKL